MVGEEPPSIQVDLVVSSTASSDSSFGSDSSSSTDDDNEQAQRGGGRAQQRRRQPRRGGRTENRPTNNDAPATADDDENHSDNNTRNDHQNHLILDTFLLSSPIQPAQDHHQILSSTSALSTAYHHHHHHHPTHGASHSVDNPSSFQFIPLSSPTSPSSSGLVRRKSKSNSMSRPPNLLDPSAPSSPSLGGHDPDPLMLSSASSSGSITPPLPHRQPSFLRHDDNQDHFNLKPLDPLNLSRPPIIASTISSSSLSARPNLPTFTRTPSTPQLNQSQQPLTTPPDIEDSPESSWASSATSFNYPFADSTTQLNTILNTPPAQTARVGRKSTSKSIRRATTNRLSVAAKVLRSTSQRVVNLAGHPDPTSPVTASHPPNRLTANTPTTSSAPSIGREELELNVLNNRDRAQANLTSASSASFPPVQLVGPSDSPLHLRGRTLKIFGPQNSIRIGLFKLFRSGLVDPLIFILIIIHGVILSIQASRSAFHPVNQQNKNKLFRDWEDRMIFSLFCVFTIEIFAKIIVSGFVFSPTNPKQSDAEMIPFTERLSVASGFQVEPLRDSKTRSMIPTLLQSSSWSSPLAHDPNLYPPADHAQQFPVQLPRPTSTTPFSAKSPRDSDDPLLSKPAASPPRLSNQQSSSSMSKKAHFQEIPIFQSTIKRSHQKLICRQTAYLRSSWNRIDFIAVASFWISFGLRLSGFEEQKQIYVFRSLSVLRLMRLMTVTEGTTTILNTLKRASPLLVNVSVFVLFAVTLFSIVGIQSFKGSFDRHCVWIDPDGVQNYTFESQSCGGHIDKSGNLTGFVQSEEKGHGNRNQVSVRRDAKGFICPLGQLCMETGNPNNGTQNFDNMAGAVLQVLIITSANTWSNMMYSLIDAEYFFSTGFFLLSLIVLNFWLMNVLVAVITNSGAEESEEARMLKSRTERISNKDIKLKSEAETNPSFAFVKKINELLRYFWLLAILVDFSFQASRSNNFPGWSSKLDRIEAGFTIVFLIEILLRMLVYFPNRFKFFFFHPILKSYESNQDDMKVQRQMNRLRAGQINVLNCLDFSLALITCLIQIPKMKSSIVYPWLTGFQIMRFYRIIIAFPRTGNLLKGLRGSFIGLVNMILFLLGMNYFATLMGSQLLRGVIPQDDSVEMTFHSLWNSFLAMYQVFSSENWTTVLYSAMAAQASSGQAFVGGILITGWFMFANFVLLQMFISVISDGFAVAEEEKRNEQIRILVNRAKAPGQRDLTWMNRLNPYYYLYQRHERRLKSRNERQNMMVNYLVPEEDPPLKYSSRPFQKHKQAKASVDIPPEKGTNTKNTTQSTPFTVRARKALLLEPGDNALAHQKLVDQDITTEEKAKAELEKQQAYLAMTPSQRQQAYLQEQNEQRLREVEFIKAHPTYDRVFWFIKQKNPVRKLCQLLVEPAYGERIFGREPTQIGIYAFQLTVFVAILGSVIVAAIATPVYKQNYFSIHGETIQTWFNYTEAILGLLFVLEFIIKVLADGFIFTPNAYFLNIWNRIDFFVLMTLISDITASLVYGGSTNRFARSLKAMRALRMINLTTTMRETFYNVLILGFGDLMDASLLTVMYIIPFAVWGQNLFSGLLFGCTDSSSSITGKLDCVGEFVSVPSSLNNAPDAFQFLMPRAWLNPYVYAFDSFRTAVLILFEIISLEGWINVMTSLMSINGKDLQPSQDRSEWNAVYTLIYNLFGATIILSLFLAVIINNFLKRSGSAFLTTEQQQWINLRKLIMRQQPSKRPKSKPENGIRNWCYRQVIQKHGVWSRMMTCLYVLHVLLLMTLTRANVKSTFDSVRDILFLLLSLLYSMDVLMRLLGLGWISFQQNGWNIYDVITIAGTMGTTITILMNKVSENNVMIQFQKVFLVAIAFKLILKNNGLNRLFKMAIGSLKSIANLLGLWIVFFLVWGIMFVENFSLTRIGISSLSRNSNYQSLANALVMLAIQSTGEGWNTFMHDYTVEAPYCISSTNFLFDDCGSATASYLLFISWNVISMYIVLNMFTGLVVDNFAYVFQTSGNVKTIDREEIRKFKDVWSDFDHNRSGYIKKEQLIPFFARLSGAFDVRIYPEELRVKELIGICGKKREHDEEEEVIVKKIDRLDDWMNLNELKRRLNRVDWGEIQFRKKKLNQMYQEAILLDRQSIRGISFTRMMLLLAHYKLIEDDQAMKLEELLERRYQKVKVDEMIKFQKIEGVLKTMMIRRFFILHQRRKINPFKN